MSMTPDEMIAVIQAYKDGKELQARDAGTEYWTWCRQPPTWDFREFDYRVKPEPPKPREWWLCATNTSTAIVAYPAGSILPYGARPENSIHVREVLE